jgi:glucose-6-phosphate 1-dehydrogenase
VKPYRQPDPSAIVIFGAGGDLTNRKLIPALFNLFLDNWLPESVAIRGLDRREMSDEEFRKHLREGVGRYSRRTDFEEKTWEEFAGKLTYQKSDLTEASTYQTLANWLKDTEEQWQTQWSMACNKIFYLAVPPSMIEIVTENLGQAGLAEDRTYNRVVVEKPFGHDLQSAHALNRQLKTVFEESQVYRIDHYLGKETVQNILAFRFANSLFEPVWNRRYVDHVQITVAEEIGIGHRGAYYEHAGALRDMVQNHLMQLLCLIAMEPPVSYEAEEIRNKKVDVLHAIRTISPEHVQNVAVRGQYGRGWIKGEETKAYREETDVSENSLTETFAAIEFLIDNWRWQDVPFYLRTGKRLATRATEALIQFRPVPHQSFPSAAITEPQPNRLIIRVQPDEGISVRFLAKKPGEAMQLGPVDMRFSYKEAFQTPPPEAYETLLLDVMLADSTQFMRADQQEKAWEVIAPILDAWQTVEPTDFPNYPAGSWGPEGSELITARSGRTWHLLNTSRPDDGEEKNDAE